MSRKIEAAITIEKFWTAYSPNNDGSMRAVDMVAYAPVGKRDKAVNVEAVSRLSKLQPEHLAADNPAIAMTWARWRAIEPAYRAWKEGQEIPVNGTPLAAWPGVSPEQADVLRTMGVRTVEEFAEVSDGIMSRVAFPNARGLQQSARNWLKGADRAKTSAALTNLETENEALKDQLEEMRQMILEMQAEKDKPKRGPGRPRKEDTSDEVAA